MLGECSERFVQARDLIRRLTAFINARGQHRLG
jgi:hypothetical protein